MKKKSTAINALDADLVWSAAHAAYRLNLGYIKLAEQVGDQVVRLSNRDLVRRCLADATMITDTDRAQARACRNYMTSAVTMQALRGELGEWSKITAKVCGLDTIKSDYDVSVITAMPHSYAKSLVKETVDARLARCAETHVGQLKDKVEMTVEIVRTNYSANYNTWFITGVTQDNHAVFFAYREQVPVGTVVNIRGSVKRLVDRATQLNRVKITEESK